MVNIARSGFLFYLCLRWSICGFLKIHIGITIKKYFFYKIFIAIILLHLYIFFIVGTITDIPQFPPLL